MTALAPRRPVAAVITDGPEAVTGVRAAHTIEAAVVLTSAEVPLPSVRHGTEAVLVAEVGTPALGRTPAPPAAREAARVGRASAVAPGTDTISSADRQRPPATPIERHVMNAQTPDTRHSRQPRPWGLIAVSTGFLVAAASVVAVGLVSLDLVPSLQ